MSKLPVLFTVLAIMLTSASCKTLEDLLTPTVESRFSADGQGSSDLTDIPVSMHISKAVAERESLTDNSAIIGYSNRILQDFSLTYNGEFAQPISNGLEFYDLTGRKEYRKFRKAMSDREILDFRPETASCGAGCDHVCISCVGITCLCWCSG